MSLDPGFRPLALCDRAFTLLSHSGPLTEDALLAHVYGGAPPAALRTQLVEPLLGDPRLRRQPDGQWTIVGRAPLPDTRELRHLSFTSLALVASGPSPRRGRIVQLVALHLRGGAVVERFSTTVNPGQRVPRYVAERVGLAPDAFADLPPFAAGLDDLLRFLDVPVVAQDARFTWAFLEAEARRGRQVLAERVLIDVNELADHLLHLTIKPTLALVAAQLNISTVKLDRPSEEARVLGLVATHLLSRSEQQGVPGLETILEAAASDGQATLRRAETVQSLPDTPGVYVMRDRDAAPLYVGKARRLRSRMAAYVHRPLGATRRLEGLMSAVQSVDSTTSTTDLEALILEDREIRRLQPRFNTVRRQYPPRLWVRLPPAPQIVPGKRYPPAPPRLELSLGPSVDEGDFVGPFRNESLAAQARLLARQVFRLDTLRRLSPTAYLFEITQAWAFLHGRDDLALTYARRGPPAVLRRLLAFDLSGTLLPADPRLARYAVLRPTPTGIEGFVLDHGILYGWVAPQLPTEPSQLAADLLAATVPRTQPEDVDVVLRWFGGQRPPTCLVHLPDDPVVAAEAIEDAASTLCS